jgi:hypothetical protein
MTEKRCSTCKEWKLYSEFSINRSQKDGHCARCKSCHREIDKERYRKNPEKERERVRKYREANPEKVKETQQKWLAANKEQRKEYRKEYEKEWRHKNKDHVYKKNREWAKEHPEVFQANLAKRRALEISTSTTDPWELQQIALFYGDRPEGYHVDHIMPLALGGRHELSNLQHLEAWMNFTKNAKHPDDWDDPRPISCRA